MPDLLTHVLFVYIVLTIASWRLTGLNRYVSVGMAGAVIPDLAKIHLLIGSNMMESALGVPFSWLAIHTLGGAIAIAGIVSVGFDQEYRKPAFLALVFGVATGFLLDAGLVRANGVTSPFLYPLTWWQPPSGDLYLSSDIWPTIVIVAIAGCVWLFTRHRKEKVRRIPAE